VFVEGGRAMQWHNGTVASSSVYQASCYLCSGAKMDPSINNLAYASEALSILQGALSTLINRRAPKTAISRAPYLRPYLPGDQAATCARPVDQPDRRQSQKYRATSRSGRGQSRNQNKSRTGFRPRSKNLLLRSVLVGGRMHDQSRTVLHDHG